MASAASYASRSAVRRFFIGGNWKCNGTMKSTEALVLKLNNAEIPRNTDVCVAPTFLQLPLVKQILKKGYIISAQNHSQYGNGAYTGEISAEMIKDFGLEWTILGHSERRALFNTTDDILAKQIQLALKSGLNIIACIGETLEERKAGKTLDVCIRQMKAIIGAVGSEWEKIVVAYEPVWAIGTGVVATPEQAQEVHAALRQYMVTAVSENVAKSLRIIYGGSVKGNNCDELIAKPDIDGFLVGGASLNGDEFISIFTAPARAKL